MAKDSRQGSERLRSRKKKHHKNSVLFICIFILGLLIMLYPMISQQYYRVVAGQEIDVFSKEVAKLEDAEVLRRMELARAYNRTLDPSKLFDPYTKEEEEGVAEYARMLEVEEKIGYVDIPKIDEKIPIYAGTSESILQRGAGHLEGTSLPVGGASTHTVITAHRGLATAKLFRNLDRLEIGDIFYVHNIKERLVYQVDQIIEVEPHDFSPVLVTENKDYATLLTCTPYMINTHRLLVRGHRVEESEEVLELEIKTRETDMRYRTYFYMALVCILLLIGIIWYILRQIKKKTERLRDRGLHEE